MKTTMRRLADNLEVISIYIYIYIYEIYIYYILYIYILNGELCTLVKTNVRNRHPSDEQNLLTNFPVESSAENNVNKKAATSQVNFIL